jgi:hypothetical protein
MNCISKLIVDFFSTLSISFDHFSPKYINYKILFCVFKCDSDDENISEEWGKICSEEKPTSDNESNQVTTI